MIIVAAYLHKCHAISQKKIGFGVLYVISETQKPDTPKSLSFE